MGTPRIPPPPPVQVTPAPDSALAQLMEMLPAAEAALAEAEQTVSRLKAGIEAEAVRQATAANSGVIPAAVRIAGAPGIAARIMRWRGNGTTFDQARFEAAYPGLLRQFRKPTKPYWEMRKEGG